MTAPQYLPKHTPRVDRAKNAQSLREQLNPSAVRFGDTLRAPDGDHKVCRVDDKAREYITTNGARTGRFSHHVVRIGLVEHYRDGRLVYHGSSEYGRMLGR